MVFRRSTNLKILDISILLCYDCRLLKIISGWFALSTIVGKNELKLRDLPSKLKVIFRDC